MVLLEIIVSMIVSFFVSLIATKLFINYFNRIGLVVKDMNKEDKPLVASSGGIGVACGIVFGLLFFIFWQTFIVGFNWVENVERFADSIFIFAGLSTILIITFVGFIDDFLIKGDKERSYGLKQWQKPFLVIAAAVPLMAVKAGVSEMYIPFIGVFSFGLIYPLLFVPVGVVGAANMVNLLAGFNGSEAGMGLIYTGMLGAYAYVNGRDVATLVAFVAFGALLAFYYFNKYPAKILAGDSLTYLLGAVLVCIAVLGNMEKAALIASVPFFIEFVLKARSRFKAESYGYWYNGKIKSFYDKIYSIPHILTIKGKYTEKQITYFLIFVELVFSSLIWVI